MATTHDVETSAREFATQFLDESFAEATDLFSAEGSEAVLDSFPDEFREGPMDAVDALEAYWWGLYGQYGPPAGVDGVTVDGTEATVELAFDDGAETGRVEVDADGVADFRFAPEYEVPDYVDESTFVERDVTVDAGDVELDGVLAVPDGDGPFPGVLLVHGAGLHDPDGTVGASKILRDLAWGLASEGVATLRYEKRLADHEVDDENRTLDRVVTDDAVAALDELAAPDEADEDALFVAGHSQGGMVAPRIAERFGDVAGVAVLDGPADPTAEPDDLSFLRYNIEPDGELDEEQEEQFEAQREAIRRIAAGDFEDDETLLGRPGTWHRSVRNCDPLETASSLDDPVLVLKTGRADEDVQPELVEFLRGEFEAWQSADLPDGSRVEFYGDVDHYFQAGPTPTTMESLYFGGNVAEYVVSDLAAWVHDLAGR